MRSKVFLAIYTHEVKEYCDEQFFKNISMLSSMVDTVSIVDNSPTTSYLERIKSLCESYNIKASFHHEKVENSPYRFQNSVLQSVNYLRDEFLKTDYDYFLIIESDVIPPLTAIKRLVASMNYNPDYGIIGAVYYHGIHEFDTKSLVEEDCVFSGCSMYRRELLEEVPFTWDINVAGCFPDSCMKYDAIQNGWRVGNIHNLQCEHIK